MLPTTSNSAAYRRVGRTSPFLRIGLPLIVLTVLGSLGLSHLHQGRRDVAIARDEQEWEIIEDTKGLSREGPRSGNFRRIKKKIDLEEELKAIQKKIDIDSFEYEKIPRLGQKDAPQK